MKAFTTTYKGPTERRGSRIIARSDSAWVMTAWDHGASADGNHRKAAEAFAEAISLEWSPKVIGGQLRPGRWAWVLTNDTPSA